MSLDSQPLQSANAAHSHAESARDATNTGSPGPWQAAYGGHGSQLDLLRSLNLHPVTGVGGVYDETPVMLRPPPANQRDNSAGVAPSPRSNNFLTSPQFRSLFPLEVLAERLWRLVSNPQTGAAVTGTFNLTTPEFNLGPQGFYGCTPEDPNTGERTCRGAVGAGPGGRLQAIPALRNLPSPLGGYVGYLNSTNDKEDGIIWAYSVAVRIPTPWGVYVLNIAYGKYPLQGERALRIWFLNGPGVYFGRHSVRGEMNFASKSLTKQVRKLKALEGFEFKFGGSVMIDSPEINTDPLFDNVIDPAREFSHVALDWAAENLATRIPAPLKDAYRRFHHTMMENPSEHSTETKAPEAK